MVKKLSKSWQKAGKKLQKVVKNGQKVVKKFKIQQTVVGWGNSSSKAFGISFADRPKAKRKIINVKLLDLFQHVCT
jgi:hypothetical protein